MFVPVFDFSHSRTHFPLKIVEQTEKDDPYSSRDDIVDESWNSIAQKLQKQTSLLQGGGDEAAMVN